MAVVISEGYGCWEKLVRMAPELAMACVGRRWPVPLHTRLLADQAVWARRVFTQQLAEAAGVPHGHITVVEVF